MTFAQLRHEEETAITITIHMGSGFLTTIYTPHIKQAQQCSNFILFGVERPWPRPGFAKYLFDINPDYAIGGYCIIWDKSPEKLITNIQYPNNVAPPDPVTVSGRGGQALWRYT